MRLKAYAVVIMLMAVAAVGSIAVASQSKAKQQPLEVKLKCFKAPCGSDGDTNWHGQFNVVKARGFAPQSAYIVTVTYPDGTPYDNYDNPACKFGACGGLKYTDENGKLPDFVWAANNGKDENGQNKPTDPPGVYRITFTTQVDGVTKSTTTKFRMRELLLQNQPDG